MWEKTYGYARHELVSLCCVLSATPTRLSGSKGSRGKKTETDLARSFVDNISGHGDGCGFVHEAYFGDGPRECHSSAHCDKL